MPPVPIPLLSKPGIRRDGTRVSNEFYLDGEWVRFTDGVPRKIGGFQVITDSLGGISRGLHAWQGDGTTYVHSGASDRIELVRIASDGTVTPPANRTPVGFTSNTDYVWQFVTMRDPITGNSRLFAHAAPNGLNIDSTTSSTIYYGDITSTAVLAALTYDNTAGGGTASDPVQVSGGMVAMFPFLMAFGNGGFVWWSGSDTPVNFDDQGSGTARVTSQKIVAGRSIRGGNGPAALLWSLDTLVRVTYAGAPVYFSFDEIGSIDILSPRSIVDYNGRIFWIGVGRFMTYTGTVQDLPNQMNRRWFFRNLNWTYRAKVFGFANPIEGEIWWCFPKGDATECDHAIVFNVNNGTWYDTPLPNGGRSAGVGPGLYRYPLMTGVNEVSNQYKLWQHEIGVNEIDGGTSLAVKSSFTTSDISWLKGGQPQAESDVNVLHLEADFNQTGTLLVEVMGNTNARSETITAEPVPIPEDAEAGTELTPVSATHRQLRFKVTSNEADGDYELGLSFVHAQPMGGRPAT